MARDRKKAKQRQRRQQRTGSRAAVAHRLGAEPDTPEDDLGAPDPLEHASADMEMAEAATRGVPPVDEPGEGDAGEVFADELEPVAAGGDDGGGGDHGGGAAGGHDRGDGEHGGGRASEGASPERARAGGSRFINFLRACVAELRRVQWPDRRQVTQATGVVMGFVIIAGAYLGVLDALWSRVVNAIL